MLYGMDDDDYKEEFSQMSSNKLSTKKILFVLLIIILAFFIVFVSFKISIIFLSKDEQEAKPNNENDSILIQQVTENNNSKDKLGEKNKENNNVYEGKHKQIPEHDIENIKTKFIPQPNQNAQDLIKEIYTSEERQVYLTFDDGPSKDITPQILDVLKENDVKATFFVLGARVDLYPETLKREYEEGHYIANHGYSHNYSKIYESKDTTFQEYIECENSIKNALENPDYNTYLFRFPGGSSGGKYDSKKMEARQLFRDHGIAYTNWNCLTGDAEGKNTKEDCINEMIRTKANQSSIILLMHDANDKTQTLEALPEIIQYFKNEGYTFKTFYEIFR